MLVRVVSATHRYQRGVLRWHGDEFDASAEEAQWGIDVGNLEATTLVEIDGQAEQDAEPDGETEQAEPPADDAEPDQAALEQDTEPAPSGRRRRK